MKKVTIYTDGACHGNPGPGGWAAVLISGQHHKEISGSELATTNNRMELQAAIEALKALRMRCEIELVTDSDYVRSGITAWLPGWKHRGWITKDKKPVKNEDLWRELDVCCQQHAVTWKWVKGHAGDKWNERCDALATQAIEKLKRSSTSAQRAEALDEFKSQLSAPSRAQVTFDLG